MLNKQECEKELKTLSIEELKQFEGLSDLTDQQATEVIETLKELSLIAHKIISHHE